MELAVVTGLRAGDLLRLRRQDCQEDGLHVRVGKTGVKMVFEWTPRLRAAVDAALTMRTVGSMYLICTRTGQRYTDDGFRAVWQKWQRTRGDERFAFHDLRRKAAKDAESVLGREHARQLLGHASQAMTARYVGGEFRVRPVE